MIDPTRWFELPVVPRLTRRFDGRVGEWIRRLTDEATFAAVVTAVVAFGYLRGSVSVSIDPPLLAVGAIVVIEAAVSMVSFSGFVALSGLVMVAELAGFGERDVEVTDGPRVAAVVPVYRDAPALDRSVESLLDSRYANLQVTVVAEPDDDASLARAAELADEHARVDRLVNTRYPGSKAGAVNYAAEVTEAPVVAVFDADERVDPGFVGGAVARLTEGADAVQGRTVPEPDGLVETLAYYESVLLNELSHRLLGLLTGFRMVSSRAVVLRRSAFERVGGYDTAMLTEDFDFAFRCFEADLAVEELFSRPSTIEAAHCGRDWWGQRKRWMTGYAQVLHRRLAGLRPLEWRSVVALATCAGAVFGNLLLLSMVSKVAVLAATGREALIAVLLAAVLGVSLLVRTVDAVGGHVDGVGVGWLLAPVVFPLYGLAGVKGAVEYAITWDGEWFHASKEG
ncbi:glycosyltransferase [Halosimplex aquaticum]|uniref:Glycosyltransferase n=1 Tax=Halosimplex aquaticum TaxID=3026162 RepID=A0ABD5XYR1_9EURY|nr:glycosyltransferase family 2 protein [Halosimplex aquaticum]